jgi:hypothetical protein
MGVRSTLGAIAGAVFTLIIAGGPSSATPANHAAYSQRYGKFLAKRLDACNACHQSNPVGGKIPIDLSTFPHNPFGQRLAKLGSDLRSRGAKADIDRRLATVAREDSDGDGIPNETEILAGTSPGNRADRPTAAALATVRRIQPEWTTFQRAYRWRPFEPVTRPAVPAPVGTIVRTNPIDRFLDRSRTDAGIKPHGPADRATLLRRASLDLTGLAPTPAETAAYLADKRPGAWERQIDRLLASPRYGERWARHWMDVWRYSDWAGWNDGGQIRDSQPHIWRWRDWIVESLNNNSGYDAMVRAMLSADEMTPDDPSALRATGFLARNFKLLSREQWLEDTVNHTSRAFLGITLHCAKCHAHMTDPIPQVEYYRFRAIFEPHQVRADRVPGQPDTSKDGLVRVYDADPKVATYVFVRGDERQPDKANAVTPGVPSFLGGAFNVRSVELPRTSWQPETRPEIVAEAVAAAQSALVAAWKERESARADTPESPRRRLAEANADAAEASHKALLAVLEVERIEAQGKTQGAEWTLAAQLASQAQRTAAAAEARKALVLAESSPATTNDRDKKIADAKAAWEKATAAASGPATTQYTPRTRSFSKDSTGRRTALAQWLTRRSNPLVGRVAVNHIWLRHFGSALAPSVADFGRGARGPVHPELLDWLAAEFMETGWDMKRLHKLILTSDAWRMDSKPDPAMARKDPDNRTLWRMNRRRLEAEAVRDNVLWAAGSLDETKGGPEIDHQKGLSSLRRSVYLRTAAEKQAEFLQVFDGPSVTECYERKQSVLPQQALALANSALALREAKVLAGKLVKELMFPDNAPEFVAKAWNRTLGRSPKPEEMRMALSFLADRPGGDQGLQRRYENLILVLFNHHEFVTQL